MLIETIAYTVLAVATLQLLQFSFAQFQRLRANRKLSLLQQQLLKEQIANTVAERERPPQFSQAWNGWRKFRVDNVVAENDNICSFYLLPHDGKPLATFKPGQHLTFRLKVPGHSKPVIRCYSLSDSGEQTGFYRVSIKKQMVPPELPDAPAGVASYYFHELQAGDIVDVKAPAGNFYLDTTEQSPVVLVAGGIGLTPSLSMLNTLHGLDSQRDIWLFYGVRDSSELVMVEHLQAIAAARSNVKLHWAFSAPTVADEQGALAFHSERVSVDLLQRCGVPMDADFYICGPAAMMKSMVADLAAVGVDKDRVHFESFGPAHVDRAVKPITDMTDVQPIAVEFGLAGKSLSWNTASGTLLELAEANGIEIESGCRAGSCGTCLTAVLAGEVDYVDDPGSAVEQGSCLPCIAVPKSDLKLDA